MKRLLSIFLVLALLLPVLAFAEGEPEGEDEEFEIVEITEDEYFVSLNHPMTKEHYISFIAAVADNGIQFEKLYPEGPAQARFKISRVKKIFVYCNKDGLFS